VRPFTLLALVAIAFAGRPCVADAPAPPRPADCVLASPQGAAASAQYGGKTYYFSSQACKDEFLTDAERYSQLYDALLELKAQGKPLAKPRPPADISLVPS